MNIMWRKNDRERRGDGGGAEGERERERERELSFGILEKEGESTYFSFLELTGSVESNNNLS